MISIVTTQHTVEQLKKYLKQCYSAYCCQFFHSRNIVAQVQEPNLLAFDVKLHATFELITYITYSIRS